MTLEEFDRFMLSKSSGRTITPTKELMAEKVWTGMKKIAMDTVPLMLVVMETQGLTIIRRVDEFTYIRKPEKPILNTPNDLDMDDLLLDALSYFVLAGIEFSRSKQLMGLYHTEIEAYNDKLTETHLTEASNESDKFRQFP